MRLLRVDPSSFDVASLRPAVDALRRGGIVAYPTDTFYGLAVDPRVADAVAALFALKGRAADAAVPVIAGSYGQVVEAFGALPPEAARLARAFWPGPLSLLCDAPAQIDPAVHAGTHAVAVRVPDHAIARALALAFGAPITATSANASGAPPAGRAAELRFAGDSAGVVVIDGGATPGGAPSTIVDARVEPPQLVRAGAIAWERVLESLQG